MNQIEKIENQAPLLNIIKTINLLIEISERSANAVKTLSPGTENESLIKTLSYEEITKTETLELPYSGFYRFKLIAESDNGSLELSAIGKENSYKTTLKQGQDVEWLILPETKININQTGLPRSARLEVVFVKTLFDYMAGFRKDLEGLYEEIKTKVETLDLNTKELVDALLKDFESEISRILEEHKEASTVIFTLNEKNKLAGIETGATRIKAGENVEITNGVLSAKVPKKLSEMTDDREHRTVTDSEKEYWNKKWDNADDKDISKALALINTGVSAWSSPGTPRQVGWWIGDFDKRTRENKEKAEKANQEAIKKLDTSILKYTYGTNSYIGRFGVDANGPYIEEVVIDG